MYLQRCLFFLLFFLLSAPLFASMGVTAAEKGGQLYFLYDPDNTLEIQDIAGSMQDAFSPLSDDLSLGYQPGTAWLKLRLTNHSKQTHERWLEVRPAHLDQVLLYQPGDHGWQTRVKGDNAPWANRHIQHRTSVFHLQLAPGETQTWYLQIKTTGNLAASLRLWEPADMLKHQGREMLVLGGFLVAALLLALINLLQAVAIRERIYAVYGAYLLTIAVFISLVEGLAHYVFASSEPLYLEPWISLLHSLLILLTWWLLRDLVHLQRLYPRLDRTINWLQGLLFVVGVAFLLLGWDAQLKPWLWKIFIVQLLFNLLLASLLAVKGNRSARFYLIAFGLLLISALFNTLSLLGWVQLEVWDNVLPALASLIHMLLMQLTINDRVYTAKRAYEKARDRTLHQALEEEQQAGLEQQQFLRTVAHEFRTPLAAIQSANELLEVTGAKNESLFKRSLEHQRLSLNKLSQLVDKALSLEDFERMQWRRDVALVDWEPLVQQVLARLQSALDDKKAKVAVQVDGSLAGDLQLLETLVFHLLDNALKHNPVGCKIRIEGHNAAGWYQLKVVDEGVGIAKEEQQRIFGKFQRGSQVTEPGLGLGLYMVDRITRLHGGKLSMVSHPNQGSSFTIELPNVA